CINGCGTPPSVKGDNKSSDCSDKSSKVDDVDFDEEDDFIADRFNDDCGAILSTPALLLPNYYLEKVSNCLSICLNFDPQSRLYFLHSPTTAPIGVALRPAASASTRMT